MDPRDHALHPERVYLGWQYALLYPDPGPPPKRPTPPEQSQVHPEWMQAQRREESQLNRPLKLAAGLALVLAVFFGLLGWPLGAVPGWGAAVAIGVCLVLAGAAGYAIWQGEQALRVRLAEERERLERLRADRERRLYAAQEEHARRFDAWRTRKASYDSQHEWYGVSVPRGVGRVDVAGGTLAGWSALVTMMGATCMDTGSEVTILDLSEGAVGADLVELAARRRPQVWTLPEDLAALDLGTDLGPEALADILSVVVSVSEEQSSTKDLSVDNAILERIVELLGGGASIAAVTAALRVLAQIGDPREDVARGLLSTDQLERLNRMFGKGASDRVVYDRVWALESQLRKLDDLGTMPGPAGPSQLRVVSVARQGGVLGNQVLGTYVTTALLHRLRASAKREPWSHVLFVCGAQRLRGDVLDRLYDACESSGTGLVTMYRSITDEVKERLGRGDSAVAFMRLGNAEEAKVAAEHIGTEHRFVLNQLTESMGTSVTDTTGDSYTSTQGSSDSVAMSTSTTRTQGSGRSETKTHEGPWGWLDEASWSRGKERNQSRSATEGDTLTESINTNTSWGRTTSQALGSTESISRTMQRAREFLVEPHELQRLPTSAFILSYHSPNGRRVAAGDANPAIASIPQSTPGEFEEARKEAERTTTDIGALLAGGHPDPLVRWGVTEAPDQQAGPAPHASHAPAPQNYPAPAPPGPPAPAPAAPPATPASGPESTATPSREELEELPPNLGAPPERLDWRKRR